MLLISNLQLALKHPQVIEEEQTQQEKCFVRQLAEQVISELPEVLRAAMNEGWNVNASQHHTESTAPTAGTVEQPAVSDC